jgi:hypothetical protein
MVVAEGDRWAGYARTIVTIARPGAGELVVRPAPRGDVGEWPWPTRATVHVLTAWDPGRGRPGEEENRIRQAALEADLGTVTPDRWPAVGVDPASGHREEGVAVCDVAEAVVLALGARYGQDAVFAWSPAAWTLVACSGGRRLALGWRVTGSGPGRRRPHPGS